MEQGNPGEPKTFFYPEHILHAGLATLGESRRKKMAKEKAKAQKENISTAVCALLNSGGGLVVVESTDKEYDYSKDGLGQDIETILYDLLISSTSSNYYDIDQDCSYLLIFVKTWSTQKGFPKLCSLNTGLFARSFSRAVMVKNHEVLDLVQKKMNGKGKRIRHSSGTCEQLGNIKQWLDKPYLRLGHNLGLAESDHLEFKDFATLKLEGRLKEAIKTYFSAFGNSDGGYLIIGVSNSGKITACGKHCEKSKLETCIEEVIYNLEIVHLDKCNSSDFHKLTIKDVIDDNDQNSGYVIFLEVKPVCCLAFADAPQSWIFDLELKEKKQLHASEWIKIITDKCSEPSLESQFECLRIGERPPLAKTVYRKKGLENLQELQFNLFGSLTDKITIKPDHLYLELKAEYPELEGLLQTVVADGEGVIILSRSWAVDLEKNRNPNVVCDALLLISGQHPKLYSMFTGQITPTEFYYSRDIAFTLKKQLINLGGYTKKLCVIPDVLQLFSKNKKHPFWPSILYPETYKLDGFETVKELLQSLLIIMFSFKSRLSCRIGTEYFNLLTTEQYEVLSRTFCGIKGPFFVHGPPGTGKTIVALKIIQKIKNQFNCSADQILFICENTPLAEYVRKQDLCQTVTRRTFELYNFLNVEHIVADEAQNFQCENENWFEKAKQILKRTEKKGIFYVFLDYFQSCHKNNTGLPPWNQQDRHTLTKVVRSPENIYKAIHETMNKIVSKNKSDDMKEILEKCECCHGVLGLYEQYTKEIDMCQIVQEVAKTCKNYLSHDYLQGDIAILCNTVDAVDLYRPLLEDEMRKQTKKLRTRLKPFVKAENIMDNSIVLDSVRRFSGLERPIVFAINPVCLDRNVDDNVALCAASRATAKVHSYYEPKQLYWVCKPKV